MMRIQATLALAASLFLSPGAGLTTQGTSVNAVQKVIQMLTDMSARAKKDKNEEEVAFAKFETWCKMEQANLNNEVKKESEQIDLLTGEIGKLGSEAKTLGEQIGELDATITKHEAEAKAQRAQRTQDSESFIAESTDYSESVDALDRALVVLSKQSYDRTGTAEALIQLTSSSRLPAKAKTMVEAFLGLMSEDSSDDADDAGFGDAPEANAYEFQSGGVVAMLKRLKDEFREKLGECQKEEANSKHAYDMVMQDLAGSIENAKSDTEEKTASKASKEEKSALNKKQVAATEDCKAADEKTLSDMEAECSEKALSFEEKQKLRGEEIEAIEKAIEIMQSDDVSGGQEHLSLTQIASLPSLLQVARLDGTTAWRRQVREFVASEGRRLKSASLSLLAEKLAANPFSKVKSLIDGMITRLLEEANQDAEHEGFCDKELGESKVTRNKLGEDIDALDADVEGGKAEIMRLGKELADLSQQLSTLTSTTKEATELRAAEKTKNEATIEDAVAAQKAVQAALAVLKEFYAKALQATGFVQTGAAPEDEGHKEGMQTFGDSYKGAQDTGGGVVALMEVVQSDFSNLQAETQAAEAANSNAYDDFMVECKKNKATKARAEELNTADKAAGESKLQQDVADLKASQDQLLAADRYHEKLVPQCNDKGQTYDERTKSRASEIASLKQALDILDNPDIETSA